MSRTLLSVLVILVLGGLLLSAFPASAQSGVHASKGPTVYAPIASRPRADVGQAVFFNVTVNGGVAPFTYQWLGLPSGCSSSNSSSLTCIPNGTGVFPIHVAVVDAMGNSATGTRLNYTVTNDPVVTITATPSTVRAGQTVQFGMVLVGGAQWWVDWNWSGLPPACRGPPSTGGLYPCTYYTPGIYNVSLFIKDSNGLEANASVIITVLQDPPTPTGVVPNGTLGYLEVGAIVAIAGLSVAVLILLSKRKKPPARPAPKPKRN